MADPKKSDRFPWRVLTDEAVGTSANDYFRIHTAYARLLLDIAKRCETPFSIGLYSSWGSGKTSVAKILQGLITENEPQSIGFVYLDVWKYAADPLKRWILFETERQLTSQEILENYTFEGRDLQSHLEFEEKWEDTSPLQINLRTISTLGRVLTFVTIFSVPIYFLLSYFAPLASDAWGWLRTVAGAISFTGIFGLLVQFIIKSILESLKGIAFTRTTKHVAAKPAFSSEKFGMIFRHMIGKATSVLQQKKIVFVFDNLDRCPESVAVEAIGVLKTYLDEPGCVYIIPCDQAALIRHISRTYITQADQALDAGEYANEFLNKFFQMTLRLPAPADIEIDDYIDQQLKTAEMTDLGPEVKDVLSLGYRGETPRQVKRVINDLIGYRALANEVESSGLIEAGALTSDLPLLTKMCVISVHWPDFLEKLSDDPELWSEIIQKIVAGPPLEGVYPASLMRFLGATRHVSPEADIRPYLFLKRIERDLALKRKTEQHLKNGETDKFILLFTESDKEKRSEISTVAVAIVRKWLEAQRLILLENAGPALVKATLLDKDNRDLANVTFDVLEHVCRTDTAEGFEKVFTISDILSIVARANLAQRRNILKSYAALVNPRYQLTPLRLQILKNVLPALASLDFALKTETAELLAARYSDQPQEQGNLDLLEVAAAKPSEMRWLVAKKLLREIVMRMDFTNNELNLRRTRILLQFQDQVSAPDADVLFAKMEAILKGARTRAVDLQNQMALDTLSKLSTMELTGPQLDAMLQALIEQASAHPVIERAEWLRPLLNLYSRLSTPQKASIGSILLGILADPTDIPGLVQMLKNLGMDACGKILDIPVAVNALHSQPAALLQRFGMPAAKTNREQILECFPPLQLLSDFSLYNETLVWDLALYGKIAERASISTQADRPKITSHLRDFSLKFIAGRLPVHAEVYDALSGFLSNHIDLTDAAISDLFGSCAIELLGTKTEEHFKDFQRYVVTLPKERKTALVTELIGRYIKTRGANWTAILVMLTGLAKQDGDLSHDANLIAELMDFMFEAAKDNPSLFSEPLVTLTELLDAAGRAKYTTWAVDKLISYEGSGVALPQMEPFLRLTEAIGVGSNTEIAGKILIFAQRMLSAAKGDQEKMRTLTFVSRVGTEDLRSQLHHELESGLESSNEEIKRQSKELIALD
jgi:KAP-like P-loop domain-containing protein